MRKGWWTIQTGFTRLLKCYKQKKLVIRIVRAYSVEWKNDARAVDCEDNGYLEWGDGRHGAFEERWAVKRSKYMCYLSTLSENADT